jgi:hypothetical protein
MDSLIDSLLGRSLRSLRHDAETDEWIVDFRDGYVLQVSAPWRLIAAGGIAVGHDDHGQPFGLPEVVDAARRVRELVKDRTVKQATAAGGTADLTIDFGADIRLEIFNNSAGEEGWMLNTPDGHWLVAQGGGRLVSSKSD